LLLFLFHVSWAFGVFTAGRSLRRQRKTAEGTRTICKSTRKRLILEWAG
jgi:hypothetical protein